MDDTNQNPIQNPMAQQPMQPVSPPQTQIPTGIPQAPVVAPPAQNTPIFQAPQMANQPIPPVQQDVTQSVPVNPAVFTPPTQSMPQEPVPVAPMPQDTSQTIIEPQMPQQLAEQPMQSTQADIPTKSNEDFLQDLYGPSSQEELATAVVPTPQETPAVEEPQEQMQQMPTPAPQEQEYIPEEEHHGFFPKPLRIFLGILVVLVIVLLGVKLFSSLFSQQESEKVTLDYWGLWEDSNVFQPLIADFEKQNPNITINYIREDPKQYNQRLLTRIQADNGPDIFRYHITWLPMLSGVLAPLPTDVLNKDELASYFPVVSQDIVRNGAVYGLPLEIDTLSLFVNKDIFDKAKATVPTTWDNFITVSRALTEKDANGKIKTAGAAIGTYDNITHAPDILSLLFVQNGVNINTMTPSENAADALTFYTSFANDQSNVWDNTLDPSQLAFAKGEVAMYFGYSWDIFQFKAANPSLNFAVYPVPHLPGRNSTIASYWVEGVSNKSKHQKEALMFMKYLAQKDTLIKLYTEEAKTRSFGELYPRKDLADLLKANDLLLPFLSQAQDAKSSFFAGETQDTGINAQMNGYLGNAVRSVLGNTSAQSAIDTLTQGVSQVLKQYGQ